MTTTTTNQEATMHSQENITQITAEREAIQSRQKAANERAADAARRLNEAVTERNRLQQVCEAFEKSGEQEPPFADLGKAAIAADRAAELLETAEREARAAEQEVREKLAALGQREAAMRREAAVTEFRAAVVEFERILQRSGLGRLSDEIRRLADVASIRLEEHSPLIDREFVTIGNYPLNAWAHSAPDGTSPLAPIEED